jgi:hypothetical protein
LLNDFFEQEDNRISYQNALVMEEEGKLVGVANYDGAKARELDVTARARCRRDVMGQAERTVGVDRLRRRF